MKKRSRAVDNNTDSRIVVYTRIKSETVHALDEIREAMPFTPTRAQMIDVALAEYVEKHAPTKQHHLSDATV